jgi:glycine cleavage system H protein
MTLEYPEDLRYLESHEYVRVEGESGTLGISTFAIDQLGDIVFLELPEVGEAVEAGSRFGTIESVKAVAELYSPVSGTVSDRNEAALDSPESLAEDPYGQGWLLKVRLDDPDTAPTHGLSADEYRKLVEGES